MFFIGDELGSLKILRRSTSAAENNWDLQTVRAGTSQSFSAQVLSARANSGSSVTLLAAGYSDGSAELLSINENDTIDTLHQWTETRLKAGQHYVGMHCGEKNIFSCTSNGALRMVPVDQEAASLAALPTRLRAWRMSENQNSFAYGGDEVDLSIWNTEAAFQNQHEDLASSTAKRKRDALFPGEVWRAKNVPNDNLGLRQPIRITALAFLSPSPEPNYHLLTGTQLGSIRRYDTRAARRPVSDWKIAKVGGIEAVEQGFNQHEVFVSDSGSNLFALDVRNGRISYSYKGLAGAVTSIAPSPTLMVSVAQDRFCRVHSTFPPPTQPGQQQEQKGEVLEKIFTKSTPTVVIWNGDHSSVNASVTISEEAGEDDDEIWDNMEDIDDDVQSGKRTKKRRNDI